MKKQYMDNNTLASNPGNITLSRKKIRMFHPEWFGIYKVIRKLKGKKTEMYGYIEEHMLHGDSQPAVVISVSPLLIAAYSEDIDCVALLRFDQKIAEMYNLREKSRLITVNTYGTIQHADLIPGPERSSLWNAFHPIIAEFVSDQCEQIEKLKGKFSEERWDRVYGLGKEYLSRMPGIYRDGRPGYSQLCRIRMRQSPVN